MATDEHGYTQINSIWSRPLETLYQDLAAAKPAPAAVTAAAVSARLGTALLIKTLEVVGRRKSFSGDAQQLRGLLEAAREQSARLAEAADEDIAADAGQRRSEVPMKAAQAAEAALELCGSARALVTGAILADLDAASQLLRAAASAIRGCVEENAQTRP